MHVLKNNTTVVAEEYSEIPELVEQALVSIEELIGTLQSAFEDGEVPEVDAVVDQYHQIESDLEIFSDEINNLLSFLRDKTEPESVDDIDKIETASKNLMQSAKTFRDACQSISTKFSHSGFSDLAESMEEVATGFDEIPGEIKDSLIGNQLLLAIKTEHFPNAVKDSIPEVAKKLDADDQSQRQNSTFILARLAVNFPTAVGQYHDRLTTRLPNAPVMEQRNLLVALVFVSEADSMPDTIARAEVLEIIHSEDTTVALYAALVLGAQSTKAKQVQLAASRIISLLDVDAATDVKINVTEVLCQLAESHPNPINEFVPDIAPFLNDSSLQVKENVVELFGVLQCAEYRTEILSIRDKTDSASLEAATKTALEELSEDGSSDMETKSNDSGGTADSSSILAEIEEEFEL